VAREERTGDSGALMKPTSESSTQEVLEASRVASETSFKTRKREMETAGRSSVNRLFLLVTRTCGVVLISIAPSHADNADLFDGQTVPAWVEE
jgi:hypothetical protein